MNHPNGESKPPADPEELERREGVVTRPEYAAYRDENEDLFRFLVDNAMDAMVILAWDGTILFTNRAGASMVGLNSPEEVIGRSILSFLHPDTVPQARRDLELVRLGWGGLGFPVEYRLRTTRGDAKWVEGLGKKITYHGSSADLILLRDITARKHAEEKAEMIRTMGLYGQMGEKRRLDLIQLVLSLSTRFLHISLEDIEGGLKSAISALGLFTAADRASLVIIPGEIRSLPRTYGWTAMGIRPSKSLLSDLCGDRFIWLKDRLRRGEVISIPDTGSLPEEALAEKEALATGGVRAILVAPLISNSHLLGCIGLESLRHPRHWTEEECLLLRLAGETFTYALERNRAEEGLRESEHRFRALIEKTSDFIMILDREGTMVFASPPIEWIDGFTPESLVGRSAFEMIAPDGVEGARRFLKDLLSHPGISSTFDTHFQGPHGMHYIEAVVTNLLDDPYVRGIVVNGRDVTYRKQAEAALHESEEKYRKLVELAADGILVHCEGKIVYVNPAGLHLLGAVSPDEVIGREVQSIVHPDYRDRIRDNIDRDLEGEETSPVQLQVIRVDGRPVWVEGRGTRSPINGKVAIQVFLRDISARKQAEEGLREYAENLRRSNEDLERFAYISSHDLQEPLRTIVSFSQLLEKRYRGAIDSEADEYIDFIVEAGKRMQHLINDLLEYSRVTTRGGVFMETDSCEILEETLSNLRSMIGESGSRITHDPLPVVMVDPPQLRQVFQNLIANAIKYRSESPPSIHVSAERTHGMWKFSVRDNGIGIEPQYFQKIFVIFQRLHGRDKYEGTGIGLALVKRIIERHGGSIWVESDIGRGSTFYFTLPALEENKS